MKTVKYDVTKTEKNRFHGRAKVLTLKEPIQTPNNNGQPSTDRD